MDRAKRALLITTLIASAALLACDGEAQGGDPNAPSASATSAAPDATQQPTVGATRTAIALGEPTERGPYAVGLTRMTFTREEDRAPRDLDTWIWYPALAAPGDRVPDDAAPATQGGPFPLVIFSHGSGGQPSNARYLTEHLASWGYVVAAPPHPGNTSDDCILCPIDVIIRSSGQRLEDVPFVLEQVLALGDDPASRLGAIIDGERTAIAGHSFGGWTAMFMAPGDRFDVSIALAPGEPRLALEPARKITSPTLIIAAGLDAVVNPEHVADLVGEIPQATDVTYVLYPEGRHLSFIDTCFGCTEALSEDEGHALTLRYVTAFLQVHLRGEEAYARYLEASPPDALVPLR